MRVAQFTKEYSNEMTKELEIPPEMLEPALLDGKQQDLVEDYLKLIVTKLDEWTANLMKTETTEFTTRSNPPEEDADGMYGMQGAVIMFQSAQTLGSFVTGTAKNPLVCSGQPAS